MSTVPTAACVSSIRLDMLRTVNGLKANWSYRDGSADSAQALAAGGGASSSTAMLDLRERAPTTGTLFERVLAARGWTDPAQTEAFLDPRLTRLHDPSLMAGIDRSAARILDALRAGDTIAIYGDYDVDGITATAILYHTLRALHPSGDASRIVTYVPHRLDEGYGLNDEAIFSLAAAGARVIVSVDCGITAVGPAARAREAGVDLIITDHHNPPAEGEPLPDAHALVHPRLHTPSGLHYPFVELSGAGVAYKLAWRLCTLASGSERVSPDLRSLLVDLLAFAALGTIADVVPLVGENRIIARHGLVRIKHSPFTGLRALVEASGLAGDNIDSSGVGFRLAPRLNAAGRMGHARAAVELFTTASASRAREIASELSAQNVARRTVETTIFEQACAMARERGMTGPDRRAIVLAHPEWHAGVVGIVCSRLTEAFCRPAILMQMKDGVAHGSGRSIDGFNLHAALCECSEILDRFGGHDMAAGLHVSEERFSEFTDRFIECANRCIHDGMLRPRLRFDGDATPVELSIGAVQELERLGPFGRSNPEVSLRFSGVRIAQHPRLIGSTAKHLAVHLRDEQSRAVLRCLGWNWAAHSASLREGALIDAVVKPRLSSWSGRMSVEPEIVDIRIHPAG